jgi:hypothetical protein
MSKFDPRAVLGPEDGTIVNEDGEQVGYLWKNPATRGLSGEEIDEYFRQRRADASAQRLGVLHRGTFEEPSGVLSGSAGGPEPDRPPVRDGEVLRVKPEDRGPGGPSAEERLRLVRAAVDRYHAALGRREHGGVACHRAMDEIVRALEEGET